MCIAHAQKLARASHRIQLSVFCIYLALARYPQSQTDRQSFATHMQAHETVIYHLVPSLKKENMDCAGDICPRLHLPAWHDTEEKNVADSPPNTN